MESPSIWSVTISTEAKTVPAESPVGSSSQPTSNAPIEWRSVYDAAEDSSLSFPSDVSSWVFDFDVLLVCEVSS